MYARTLPGPEKQPLLRDYDFFYADDIQLQIQVAPLGHTLILIPTLTLTITLTTRLVGCEVYSKVMPK